MGFRTGVQLPSPPPKDAIVEHLGTTIGAIAPPEKRHPLDVFFQLYLLVTSYIAAQLYSATPSDIVLRTVK